MPQSWRKRPDCPRGPGVEGEGCVCGCGQAVCVSVDRVKGTHKGLCRATATLKGQCKGAVTNRAKAAAVERTQQAVWPSREGAGGVNVPASPPALRLPPLPSPCQFAEPAQSQGKGACWKARGQPLGTARMEGCRVGWGWGKMESNQHNIHQETDFGKFKQCPILWASAA